MSKAYLQKEWPSVTWDEYTLNRVAEAVRAINPHVVHVNDESAADYIRDASVTMLYRANQPEHGMSCGTGGWTVVFVATDTPGHYTAWPAIDGYTALRYAKEVTAKAQ